MTNEQGEKRDRVGSGLERVGAAVARTEDR